MTPLEALRALSTAANEGVDGVDTDELNKHLQPAIDVINTAMFAQLAANHKAAS